MIATLPYKVLINRWVELDNHYDILYWLCEQFGAENNGKTFQHAMFAGQREITDPNFSKYLFMNQADAVQFNLVWNKPGPRTLFDLSGGRKYGFPKILPDDQLDRISEWLIENGYPDHLVYEYIPYIRMIPEK